MAQPVYVIGAGRTDFKRHFKKEGKALRHIILEAARLAVTDAGIESGDVEAGVVCNFAGGLFAVIQDFRGKACAGKKTRTAH